MSGIGSIHGYGPSWAGCCDQTSKPVTDAQQYADPSNPNGETTAQSQGCGCAQESTNPTSAVPQSPTVDELTLEEQRKVTKLQDRDREVRAHEQAHKTAAGRYAQGGPQYEYTTGPDGKQYAVGGSVAIDTSKVPDDPAATIQKAQAIKRAALAPAQPSSEDHRIAAKASRMEAEARSELQEETQQQAKTASEQMRQKGLPDIATVAQTYSQCGQAPDSSAMGGGTERLSLYT
jgi:hypothetical protein